MVKKTLFILLTIISICIHRVNATHIRAGEIIAVSRGVLTYEITFILYRNIRGVDQRNVTIDFGDGSAPQVVDVSSRVIPGNSTQVLINSETEKLSFTTTHTFPAPSTFTISVREVNRNGGIKNIQKSEEVAFYVESQITIDPLLGTNSSPRFLVDPIDNGAVRQIFTHSPGVFDPDGDSLSFSLVEPKSDRGVIANGYQIPSSIGDGRSNSGGPPIFRIDPVTGLVTWDAPAEQGLYNFAFVVTEWRNGVRIGFTTRDMQIQINDNENIPPTLIIPSDTCITAGTRLIDTVRANDSPGSTVILEAFGGVFSVSGGSASFNRISLNNTVPIVSVFDWQTTCAHVQQQPYLVTFKATDNPAELNRSLVTQKVWQIRVVPPPPKLNTPTLLSDGGIVLTWDTYICANFTNMILARRVCDTTPLSIDSCTNGALLPAGFKKIATLNPTQNTFTDSDTKVGETYCYLIFAEFPQPRKGISKLSNMHCISPQIVNPIPFNISVQKTDTLNGEIKLKWAKPKLATPSDDYRILIYRTDSTAVGSRELIYNRPVFINDTQAADTTWIDNNVNTNHMYFYQLYLTNQTDTLYKSEPNTNIRLKGLGRFKRIDLKWDYQTEWSNFINVIFEKTSNGLVALDSTINTSYSISVSEDQIGVEKTFVVKTKGQYGCSDLLTANQLPHPLINFSQEISIAALDSIADTLAPCPPKLNIIGQTGCANNQNNVQKVLYWKPVLDFGCETDIKEYQLAAHDNEATIITTTTDTFAVETNSIRFDRCFKVRAVSQKNIKSSWSNIQCFLDVCENYELPNLFTPNGDGYNDVFEPIPFPSPTAAFNIKIYNRFGTKVFETNNPQINWTGEGLPEGLYYYLAEITFLTQSETGQEAGRKKVIKSWVQLLR